MDKVSFIELVEKYQDLVSQRLQLKAGPATRSRAEVLSELEVEIASLSEALEEAESAMAVSQRMENLVVSPSSSMDSAQFRTMAKAVSQRVVPFSPKGEFEVEQWLDLFEIICRNLKVPDSSLTEVFLTCIEVKDVALVTWANTELQVLNWEQARKTILGHFYSKNALRRYNAEFIALRMDFSKPLNEFIERISLVAKRAKRDINSVEVMDKFISCLPYKLKELALVQSESCGTFKELSEFVANIAIARSALKMDEVKQSSSSSQAAKGPKDSFQRPSERPVCSFCKKIGHSIDKCFSKKNQERNKFQKSSAVVAAMEGNLIDLDETINENKVHEYSLIEVPLFYKNIELRALVDCGAQGSILSALMVKQLCLETWESKLKVSSCTETSTESARRTAKLEMNCQGKTFKHQFVVKEFSPNFKFEAIIGLDVFAKLGMYVGGLEPATNDGYESNVKDEEKTRTLLTKKM